MKEYATSDHGFCVFMTGLPGAGKTTLAHHLGKSLNVLGRTVTMLDGDEVRRHLSSELGFSRDERNLNVRRVGFVASEIARHGGVAVCSLVAPFDEARKAVRAMVIPLGEFLLVYLSTPLEVCEHRDAKGNYAKARLGKVSSFTGISDPYEIPDDADLVVDMSHLTPDQGVEHIVGHLEVKRLVDKAGTRPLSSNTIR